MALNLIKGFIPELFGYILEETPKHEVIRKIESFEVREYSPQLVAEVTYEATAQMCKAQDEAFFTLARYIGAFGKAENMKAVAPTKADAASTETSENIAMTSPVLVQPENIAMTAPVLVQSESISMTSPVLVSEAKPESIAMTSPVLVSGSEQKAAAGDRTRKWTMQFVLPASKYTTLDSVPRPTDPNVRITQLPPRRFLVARFSGNLSESAVEAQTTALRRVAELHGVAIQGEPIIAAYNAPFTLPWCKTNEVLFRIE